MNENTGGRFAGQTAFQWPSSMSEIIAAIICMEAACQEGEFPKGHKSGSHKVAEMKEEGGQQRRKMRPEDDA